MDLNFTVPQNATGTISGADASGNPSTATITNLQVTSANTAVATVTMDASNPLGFTASAVSAGTATFSAIATATFADGTSKPVTGNCQVIVTAGTTGDALTLTFNWNAPTS